MSGRPAPGAGEGGSPGPAAHAPIPSAHGGTEPYVVGAAAQTDVGNVVLAYLLAGPLTFGGAGWLVDWLLGTVFLMPVGVLLGMGLSMYVIWLRYGRA